MQRGFEGYILLFAMFSTLEGFRISYHPRSDFNAAEVVSSSATHAQMAPNVQAKLKLGGAEVNSAHLHPC